jgi:zinc transport system substrate-binding protein
MKLSATILLGSLALGSLSCADDGPATATAPTVAVAFAPIEEIVRRVAGDLVTPVPLTPAGKGPHDVELEPRTATALERSTAVFLLGRGFQPAIESAAGTMRARARVVDLLDGLPLLTVTPKLDGTQGEVDGEVLDGDTDPHVWLDPVLMQQMTDTVERTLAEVLPAAAERLRSNAAAYRSELAALDAEFRAGLQTCRSRVVVTSHRAFGYLARRYGLEQLPIAGLSPDEEPDPRTLTAITRAARAKNVQVIFFEEQLPDDLARTVADEIGVKTSALDPIEAVPAGSATAGRGYVEAQRANLAALRAGLGCT